MKNKILVLVSLLIIIIPSIGLAEVPGVIKEFCEIHFNNQIANIGEPFNATDINKKNLPFRRIIDFAVTSLTAYLWYEHGGRGYHQHVVAFSTINPNEIYRSCIFLEYIKHKSILDLLKDNRLLEQCLIKAEHL